MVFRPVLGLTSLTLVLAAYFFVDGIFEIFESFDLKPLKGWGWMLFGGIVSVLLGIMIYTVTTTPWAISDEAPLTPTTVPLAQSLFSESGFILPVEIAAMLLLAAILGAIVIAREKAK